MIAKVEKESEIYWTVSFLHTLINKTVEKCISIHMCGPYWRKEDAVFFVWKSKVKC